MYFLNLFLKVVKEGVLFILYHESCNDTSPFHDVMGKDLADGQRFDRWSNVDEFNLTHNALCFGKWRPVSCCNSSRLQTKYSINIIKMYNKLTFKIYIITIQQYYNNINGNVVFIILSLKVQQ